MTSITATWQHYNRDAILADAEAMDAFDGHLKGADRGT